MKNHNPRLELTVIPIGGVDETVQCSLCPAACCREDMILPLTKAEARFMHESGTDMVKLDKKDANRRPPLGRKFYRFVSACGNLAIDDVTGRSSCAAYENPDRPKICAGMKMGGFACASTQLERIKAGQDERVPSV